MENVVSSKKITKSGDDEYKAVTTVRTGNAIPYEYKINTFDFNTFIFTSKIDFEIPKKLTSKECFRISDKAVKELLQRESCSIDGLKECIRTMEDIRAKEGI